MDLSSSSGQAKDQSSGASSEQPEAPAPKVEKTPNKSVKDAAPTKPESKAGEKAADVAKAAWSAANSIFSAWKAYDNNMVIKHKAEKIRRQSIEENLSAAANTGLYFTRIVFAWSEADDLPSI